MNTLKPEWFHILIREQNLDFHDDAVLMLEMIYDLYGIKDVALEIASQRPVSAKDVQLAIRILQK
jgi:hypothetical protein